MDVKITNTKQYFCWKCGASFYLAENIRIVNHSKTCGNCTSEVFTILNKYDWKKLPTIGRGFALEVDLSLAANDWFVLQEFGFSRAEGLETIILHGPQNIQYCEPIKKEDVCQE